MNGESRAVGVRRFLVGQAGPFPRVVFWEEAFAQMDQFAQEHPGGENGGFLVGTKRNLKSLEEYEILVEHFVPLAPSRGGTSRFAMSRDHYMALQKQLSSSGSNLRIVGWMHSHPGFGVFLSAFDKEQHERLFPRPWQIAYVIDAQHGDRALYHCVDRVWRELPGYYILRSEDEAGVVEGSRPRWARAAASVVLFLMLTGAGVYGYHWYNSRFIEPLSEVSLENMEPPAATTRQESVVTVTPAPVRVEPPPPQAVQSPPEVEQPEPAGVREYLVARGDSLWNIAEKVYGDATLYRIIAEANNISNPEYITAGTTLMIPERPNP